MKISQTPCPVCSNTNVEIVKTYQEYGFLVELHKCHDCGFTGEMVIAKLNDYEYGKH